MLQLSQQDVAVHFCTFEGFLERAKVNLRFPSLFFVEWKTINGKSTVSMIGRKRAINSQIQLNQTLIFTTEMLYHRAQKQYLKKESLIHLNLISNSRPDQVKLVGRVVVDLSEIANTHKYSSVTTTKLMYCSVDADISFSMKLVRSIDSNLELNQLDRSSFSDLYSFTTSLKNTPKVKERKESMSQKRNEEQRRKVKRFSDREETASNVPRSPQKEIKMENILIRDHNQQINQEKSLPNSLPLTEKKIQPSPQVQQPILSQRQSSSKDLQRIIVNAQFDASIQRQKDILQRQLNEHKNRIKKLQTDIKQVLRQFELSQQNSELNRSKLIQSEKAINNLKDSQTKIKQYYEMEIANIKQTNARQMELIKSGYQADVKILKVTIEEQRLKSAEEQQNNQKVMEQYQQLLKQNELMKLRLKDQDKFSIELAEIKTQNQHFHAEKEFILASIDQKEVELTSLQEENRKLAKQIENNASSNQTAQFKQILNANNSQIQSLKIDHASKIAKIEQLEKELIFKQQHILQVKQQAVSKLHQSIFQFQQKLLQSADTLAKVQQENTKLAKQLQNRGFQSLPTFSPIDTQTLENYQRLKQQHNKLTILLQNIKKSIIFPQQQLRQLQQAQAQLAKPDLFVIIQRSQLQQIQISELKQENATMREKMGQLVQEHEHLKSSRSNEEQKPKLDYQLQIEELTLIKEELANSKELEASLLRIQQSLEQQISELKGQLSNNTQQLESLKIKHTQSKQEIDRLLNLNSQLQSMRAKAAQITPQNDLTYSLKPQHGINIDGEDSNINITLRKNKQSQTANLRVSIQIQPLEHIEEHNDEAPVENQHHDFNFEEHSPPLTHEELNKITEIKDNHNNEEIYFLRDENSKLKEEIQQFKFKRNIQHNEGDNKYLSHISQLQQKLKQMQSQNESLKLQIANLLLQPSPRKGQSNARQNDEVDERYAAFESQIQSNKKTIANLEAHLNELQRKNEELQLQVTTPIDHGYIYDKQNANLKDLQCKLAVLQQELKIKDEILIEGEKNLEQNYAIKYQLAELKEKYSEIKSALDERDEMINYLEQTKQQLSKQLQQSAEKSHNSDFKMNIIEVKEEEPYTPSFEAQQQIQNLAYMELTNEVQGLKKELVSLNNYNTDLRSQIEDSANQKSSIERINQQNQQKLQQNETIKHKLQSQVNELSLLINGLNLQHEELIASQQSKIDKLTSDMLKLSEQLHSLQLNYNNLIGQSLAKQEKISQLQKQCELTKQRVEQLTILNNNTGSKLDISGKVDLPYVQIHEVDSFNEAPPLQYEHSTIPLQQQQHNRHEVKEQGRPFIQDLNAEIESLKQQIYKLTMKLAQQSKQKNTYFNNLELSNNKVVDLQVQVVTLKQQIDKLTSLPIQSFGIATPTKNRFQYQASRHMREPSIVYQPRVKGEHQLDLSSPQKTQFSRGEFTKDIETRMETNVINQSEHELLQQELDMLKQELQSEKKLHNELQQIHNMCEKKYQLLNNHYENCLQQLDFFKVENQELASAKQNLSNQLYYIKEGFSKLQAQYEAISNQYRQLQQNKIEPKQVVLQTNDDDEMKDVANPQPNLFLQFRQSSKKQQAEFAKKQQQFLLQKELNGKQINQLKSNQEKLINKINLLEENMFCMERALQQQIQINQANDKITEKLEQLNQLQSMAAQFQQELEDAKANKQQLAIIKGQRQQLLKQKDQMIKAIEQHNHCIEEKAEWQQKLQTIQHMLMNNEIKYAEEKQQLQSKVLVLNEEKAHLEAQKTIIYQNNKKGSEIVIENQFDQFKNKQNQLYNELQISKNEKLAEMQKLAQLQEKINKENQTRAQKDFQILQVITSKDHQIEEIKFINVQLIQELQEIKLNISEKQLYANNYKADIQKLNEENAAISHQVINSREKLAEGLNILNKKQMQIQQLHEQLAFLQESKPNNSELTRINNDITILHEEISQKIAIIQQLQNRLKEAESQIVNIKVQLESKNNVINANEQRCSNAEEQLRKAKEQNNNLQSKRNDLQKEVQALNSRYSQLQQAVKNAASAKDKNLQFFRSDINKKQQEVSDLSKKIKSKQSDIVNLTKELDNLKIVNQKYEQKIQQLAEKERIMKETMESIQAEAQKIVQSLKSKYESEEIYYRKCIQKERENNRLAIAVAQAKEEIANKERVLIYLQQKSTQLQNQLQILKKGNGQGVQLSPKIVTIQYQRYQLLMQKNEQLMNKNRQYLEIISHKTTSSNEAERLKKQIKEIQQMIAQYEQNNIRSKQIIETRIPQLQKQLEITTNQKHQLIEKINELTDTLQVSKQESLKNNHKLIQNLLTEKDKQITILKQSVKKTKEPEVPPSLIQEAADSNISILNEQILNLNRQILEKDNELQKLKAAINKSQNTIVPRLLEDNVPIDEQKEKMRNQIQQRQRRQQEYKESISKLKEQLKKGKSQSIRQQLTLNASPTANVQNIEVISHDLHNLCAEIKVLCLKRSNSQATDKLFQSFVQKYDLMEEQFNNLNAETSVIQQKAKFISKQLQKIKSYIIKGQNRAFKQKTELLAMIKPCEIAASELVNISQTLSQRESQNYIQ